MVSALKRGGRSELADFFGRELALRFSGSVRADLVTFVPVSEERLKQRGYNQAELIARSYGRFAGIPAVSLLHVNGSGDQKTMHYHERFLNILGRFGEGESSCSGKTVVLVDDVFTTGATVNEASRILKKMGASSVFSLTVARVDNKKVVIEAVPRLYSQDLG